MVATGNTYGISSMEYLFDICVTSEKYWSMYLFLESEYAFSCLLMYYQMWPQEAEVLHHLVF